MDICIEKQIVQEINLYPNLIHPREFKAKLHQVRVSLNRSYSFIHRLAVAIYHPQRDVLQTYVYDEDIDSHIKNYEANLSACKSLKELVLMGKNRIVNDLSIFDQSKHAHSALIRQAGYLSSISIPLRIEGQLLGFLFINSREKHAFDEQMMKPLSLISLLFALLLLRNLEKINVLRSTVESMKIVSFERDPETAEHQQRMASYSLLIARAVASIYHLTDPVINDIYLYAPLHDLGKLMIVDAILLKAGPLTTDEFLIMQTHTNKGQELAKKLIALYQLSEISHISILYSIIRSHHEKMDGSGYPDGLNAEQIPISARIVAVADIFDALTSVRAYKKAWTNEDAFLELQKLAGTKLDTNCVKALLNNKSKILEIQQKFQDK